MKSIQRQLSVNLSVGMFVLLLLAIAVGAGTLSHELDEGFDSALREAAERLLSMVELGMEELDMDDDDDHDSDEMVFGVSEELELHDLLFSYVARAADGKLIAHSRVVDPDVFSEEFHPGYLTRAEHRLYAVKSSESGIVVEVAEPLAHRTETLTESLFAFALPLLLLIPLSLILVRFVVRKSMVSIRAAQEQVEQRGGTNLHPISTSTLPAELKPVVKSVNEMMMRLSQSLDAERNFATHSAHELRTPIASALSQIQRQISNLPEGSEQSRARRIEATLFNLARTSEKLMQLSRAESGFLVTDNKQDLYSVIEHVVTDFSRSTSTTSTITIENIHDARLLTRLDADGFGILLRNLIENALKHGDRDGEVRILVDSHLSILRIRNACDVIAEDQLRSIRSRFVRGNTQASGSGLGLAIVDSLVSRAGLKVDYHSPVPGEDRGFEVVVQC